jgi:hypothetical protein
MLVPGLIDLLGRAHGATDGHRQEYEPRAFVDYAFGITDAPPIFPGEATGETQSRRSLAVYLE